MDSSLFVLTKVHIVRYNSLKRKRIGDNNETV